MSLRTAPRTLPWDWFDGHIPQNVSVDHSAYLETTYSFLLYRSKLPKGVRIGRGSATYLGTMFDVGPHGRVTIGDFSLIHGAWFICDSQINVGDYALISWNVVFMDSYGVSQDPAERRSSLNPSRSSSTAECLAALRLNPSTSAGTSGLASTASCFPV